ncbi:MAG: PEP-CTERM sorting domain-containing protein [Verrucomicrobia bacterium]|nr:MAG: PEP-CTERM sorting domain-containing protein [Verrucomicrobiota bacterium]
MKLQKLLIGLLVACGVSQAATINVGGVFSAASGLGVKTSTGTVLSSGGYVIAVGSFTTVPTVLPDASNLAAAVSSLNVFQTLTSPTAAGNTQGAIVGGFTAIGGGNASLFNGKQIYVVVGNGSTLANSNEFAILTTATNVLFPADVTGSAATTVTLSSITNSVVLPNAGLEDANGAARDLIVLASPVPEPSIALLGALGIFGLVRRRR